MNFATLANQTINWLVTTQATLVICGAILAVAIGAWGWARWRLWQARRELRAALDVMKEITSEREFAARYEDLHSKFSDNRLLGHAWIEFTDTLILPAAPGDVCRNSEPPELYFNAEAVASGAVNLRLLHAIPNYLTGFGILGTFIGLAAGIYLANLGLQSEDLDETRSALKNLLGGAGLAFTTSIVGLGSSILLSWTDKASLQALDRLMERWNVALERCLKRATPEQLGAEQLAELKKQTLQLERFNTDLAVSIAEAIDNRVSESLSPKFNELVEGLRQLKGQQGEFSDSVLNRVTEQISASLSGAAGTEMREMATTLRALVEILRESAVALQSGQRQMADAAEGLVQQMRDAFGQSATQMSAETAKAIHQVVTYVEAAGKSTAEQLQRSGDESTRKFAGAFASMETGISGFSGSVDQLTRTVQEQRALAERVAGLVSSMGEVQVSLRKTIEPLTLAASGLSAAGGVLSERLAGLEHISSALRQVASETTASQERLQRLWADYEKRFNQIDVSLERAFKELNAGIDAYTSRIRDFMIEVDGSLARSVEGLSGVAGELLSGVDELGLARRQQS